MKPLISGNLLRFHNQFRFIVFLFITSTMACLTDKKNNTGNNEQLAIQMLTQTSLLILGTLQDGGSPHIGCKKDCCKQLFENPDRSRMVVSLCVIDPGNRKSWLFEATPDLPYQMKLLQKTSGIMNGETSDGIFLTHAHIGHYSGLMYLGREAMGAMKVPVYAMPGMKKFLETNGPWNQLVSLKNISIIPIQNNQKIVLSSNLTVKPLRVPHRDEYSETVGYVITGPDKSVLFIPDIDKWSKWDKNIIEEIKKVDYAFIDGTFYDGHEVNRDISEIPHPFVTESMELFKDLPNSEKAKIYFIHFNHTNPLLNPESSQAGEVLKRGFHIAQFNQLVPL